METEKFADKYNVISLRNGKETIWNKKPLSEQEANEMMKELERATIPSVDNKTIKKVKASDSNGIEKIANYIKKATLLDIIKENPKVEWNKIKDNVYDVGAVYSLVDELKKAYKQTNANEVKQELELFTQISTLLKKNQLTKYL